MRIYLRLAEISRIKRGWTLRRLADELDMDYQNVINWNTGRSIPHLSTLIAIARILRCSIDELIIQEAAQANSIEAMNDYSNNPSEPYISVKPLPPKRGRPPKKNISYNQVKCSQNL